MSCGKHGLAVSRPCAGYMATASVICSMRNVGSGSLEEMIRDRKKFKKFIN